MEKNVLHQLKETKSLRLISVKKNLESFSRQFSVKIPLISKCGILSLFGWDWGKGGGEKRVENGVQKRTLLLSSEYHFLGFERKENREEGKIKTFFEQVFYFLNF